MVIDLFFVIMGLFIGFMVVYIISPPPRIIIKYPTSNNINNITYTDDNNQHYKYKMEKC